MAAQGSPVRLGRLAALVALFLALTLLLPRPEAITPQGWRTFAIFVSVIAGMAMQPMPGAALVLLGLTAMTANGTPMREALGGFAEPSVWLVVAAMLMARAILDSGLARRIALLFIRRFGRSSLGIAYALVMTDVTLASGVPSITARSAGMVLPIGRGIAELFGSTPGPTAPRLARRGAVDRASTEELGDAASDRQHHPGRAHGDERYRSRASRRSSRA